MLHLVVDGRPSSRIAIGAHADDDDRRAAGELARYVERLSGTRLEVRTAADSTLTDGHVLLLVGAPEHHEMIDAALPAELDPRRLGPEGFVLHCGDLDGRRFVIASGREAIGTLYAVYALVEMLGVTFTLAEDLLPPRSSELALVPVSRAFEPALSRRGFQFDLNNLHNSIWGIEDYGRLIEQMIKLRLNHLGFFAQCHGPWIDYAYRGEKALIGDLTSRESGYLRIKQSVPDARTVCAAIGAEHFADRKFMAPPHMQDVRSPEQARQLFIGMVHEVFALARERGMTTSLAFDAPSLVPNLGRYARNIGARPYHFGVGVVPSPTDAVGLEIIERMVEAFLDAYPEIDAFYAFGSENYALCPHPDSEALRARMRPRFEHALSTLGEQWQSVCAKFQVTPDRALDADIGGFEIARSAAAIARRLRPDLEVGVGSFFRGYLLRDADRLLERDLALVDWQSSGVFPTVRDVNASYFSGMGDRRRYIIVRGDDDGSMFGMPFYLRQFQRDGCFSEAVDAGVTGFMCQLYRARGTEHHIRFLAGGAWDADLTPQVFYRQYAQDVFGPAAAAAMVDAFECLEDGEQQLGWRGQGNFTWLGVYDLRMIEQRIGDDTNPFDGPSGDCAQFAAACRDRADAYDQAIDHLGAAQQHMDAARSRVSEKGRGTLEYLAGKTRAYRTHLETLVLVNRAATAYAEAFINRADDERALAAALAKAERMFDATCSSAEQTARHAAEIVDHPSDLAILFLANIWDVAQTARLRDIIRRVCNYHHGRPYWVDAPGSRDGDGQDIF
ncbi:MAG: hypothetical protein CMJ18_01485 [Phycisphaeraceae bacterium]|nr:hypothetical protein [Phycisphaeraceae bacterium]